MNKIVNKISLAGYKFLAKLDLRQPGYTYSTCRPITKHREKIKKFQETYEFFDYFIWNRVFLSVAYLAVANLGRLRISVHC